MIYSIETLRGKIFHFSNTTPNALSWADFAEAIFTQTHKDLYIRRCHSTQYPAKAPRPRYSLLNNNSLIQLPDWKL